MFFISILLIQVQEVQKQAKIMIFPQTPPWILKFFVILMSTCYNKSNLKVKESSEQFWIEMSISNGVICIINWLRLGSSFLGFDNAKKTNVLHAHDRSKDFIAIKITFSKLKTYRVVVFWPKKKEHQLSQQIM